MLWQQLDVLSNLDQQTPWCVVGDFNTILSSNEKKGG